MSERLRIRRSRRALAGAVAIVALAGLIVASTGSAANSPEPAGSDGLFTPAWTPLGVSGAPQSLMVQMTGDPVAVTEANAGHKLGKAEKDALKSQLKSRQDAIKGSIAEPRRHRARRLPAGLQRHQGLHLAAEGGRPAGAS